MNEISEKVKAAGVVGAGGAGFPTHVKLSAKADIFVVNGAECEPMLRNDQQLMAKSPELLVKGLNWAMQATGAKEGIIALKAKYGEAIAALQPMLAANQRIEILRDVYPAGDEVITLWMTTGRRVPPGGIPIDVGAVLNNPQTLMNVAHAMEDIPDNPYVHHYRGGPQPAHHHGADRHDAAGTAGSGRRPDLRRSGFHRRRADDGTSD